MSVIKNALSRKRRVRRLFRRHRVLRERGYRRFAYDDPMENGWLSAGGLTFYIAYADRDVANGPLPQHTFTINIA